MKGRDPVPPEVRILVFQRDGGCVAPRLGATEPCRYKLTLDHVRDVLQVGAPIVKRGPERKHRYRSESDARHLVSVCLFHHVESGWAVANRPLLRAYLRSFDEPVAA